MTSMQLLTSKLVIEHNYWHLKYTYTISNCDLCLAAVARGTVGYYFKPSAEFKTTYS